MTSMINNENENIDANKENCHNNLDEFINKQINIAKNHSKVLQNQINKGLNELDQNNNCIKQSITINPKSKEIKDGLNSNINYNNLIDEAPSNISKNANNNIFNNIELIESNDEDNEKEDNMEICSNLDEDEGEDNILMLTPPNFLENDKISESEHQKITENLDQVKVSLIPLNIDINKMFRKRESDNLLLKCGETSYKYNKVLEESAFRIPSDFLNKHKINPYIRTKMVDWMIEVLSVFDSTEETFFLAVNIMDLFFWKTQSFYKNENVHLIGVAAMFIASKFQEIYPISLNQFVHKIGHDQFNASDIKKMECKILEDITPENLVSTSVYDFSKTYFYDFYYNNKNLITSEEDAKIYKYIKATSVYLNKLILHYEFFYQENCSIKAIGCIVTSMKIVGDYLKEKFTHKTKGIYNDWMLFLIEQGGFSKQKVEVLANKIYTAYQHYKKSKSISRNLNRFTPLPYINNNL